MERSEKNTQMRNKIMESAFHEFSQKSFGEASLNAICSNGNISKGIIYHYFKGKDALYLACVDECFEALSHYLNESLVVEELSLENGLTRYYNARISFFESRPYYQGVYFSAIINPPPHLLPEIKEIRSRFNAMALSKLTTLLKTVKLRPELTVEEVVEVFRDYQDFLSARAQLQTLNRKVFKEYEARSLRSLLILFYGIVERDQS